MSFSRSFCRRIPKILRGVLVQLIFRTSSVSLIQIGFDAPREARFWGVEGCCLGWEIWEGLYWEKTVLYLLLDLCWSLPSERMFSINELM